LVFHSSTIAMMHGPLNIRYMLLLCLLAQICFTCNTGLAVSNFLY